jgi:drug/metabolite transporter (DMT)-like permease
MRSLVASPVAGLATAVFLWSGNFVVGRALRYAVAPVAVNFWRWAIALAVLLPFTWSLVKEHRVLLLRHWKLLAVLGVTGIATFQTLVYVAVSYTTTANALLLLSLSPLAIALVSWLAFAERLSNQQLAGIALAFVGAVAIISHGSVASLAHLSLGKGELIMLVGVVLWTLYSLLLKRVPKELPQPAVLSATSTAGVAAMLPAYFLMPSAGNSVFSAGWEAWSGLLYVALVATIPPFLLWNWGVQKIGPSRAGAFIYLMPAFGALLAFIFLGESLQLYQMTGGAAIFAGIAVMNWKRA